MNMQEAGLFKLKDKKAPGYFDWNWEKIKDQFKLVNGEVNLLNPSDISFVYNGYSPISVKLLELILEHNGLSRLMNLVKLIGLNEENVRVSQAQESKFFSQDSSPGAGVIARPMFKKKRILVYFIGGITFAEIAALRFLQQL